MLPAKAWLHAAGGAARLGCLLREGEPPLGRVALLSRQPLDMCQVVSRHLCPGERRVFVVGRAGESEGSGLDLPAVSSTEIRQHLARGEPVAHLVAGTSTGSHPELTEAMQGAVDELRATYRLAAEKRSTKM